MMMRVVINSVSVRSASQSLFSEVYLLLQSDCHGNARFCSMMRPIDSKAATRYFLLLDFVSISTVAMDICDKRMCRLREVAQSHVSLESF